MPTRLLWCVSLFRVGSDSGLQSSQGHRCHLAPAFEASVLIELTEAVRDLLHLPPTPNIRREHFQEANPFYHWAAWLLDAIQRSIFIHELHLIDSKVKMGWPYKFVDLTDAQKEHRRILLDDYGLIAQASAGAVLISIQLIFLAQWIQQRNKPHGHEVPSSPSAKHHQRNGRLNIQRIQQWWWRLTWWAGDSMNIFGIVPGTNGQVLGAAIWTIWLLFLCFAETGNGGSLVFRIVRGHIAAIDNVTDYLHLTKRFGIVGASQLPLHYLLIWKSSWSPIQILTRASHETLNAYHQLLGRVVTLLVLLHAAFYLNFYVQNNLLASKLQEAYVLCGVVGVVAFIAVGTTALSPVRRWSYRLFYVVHVALATALIPVLFFHVHHIRIYLYETAAIYLLNGVIRWLFAINLRGSIRSIPGTSLVEISIPIDASSAARNLAESLHPGQHAYVSLAGNSFLRTFRTNPFTVASIPSTDGHIKFIARALDGNTKTLKASTEKDSANTKVDLTVEGAYGLNTHEDRLLQYDRVLFIAGGVGATFIVPLYRQLLADLSPGKGSYRRQKVSFVWIAKSKSEVTWAVPMNQLEKEGFVERLKVCLTDVSASSLEGTDSAIDYDESDGAAAVGNDEDGIELEEQKQLLSDGVRSNESIAVSDLPIYTGRPDLRRLVQQALSHGSNERVAIVTCGPKGLSRSLRREITPWIKRGRDVWFHDESFSL